MYKSISESLHGHELIVALNSEPYIHYRGNGSIHVRRGSGGAQHLMDYVMRKTGGTMIAVGSTEEDKQVVDEDGKIEVPEEKPKYTLKRLFLQKQDYKNYYYGFSNQTLWPMCHLAFVKPIFNKTWWEGYKKINQLFAKAILQEVKTDKTIVWINDYQLCLVPKILKQENPKLKIGMFWHIPWPTKELFTICPWDEEILEGMIASDFIGFHRRGYVVDFISTVMDVLPIGVMPSPTSFLYKKHITEIGELPAGIDYKSIYSYVKTLGSNDFVKRDFGIEYRQLVIGVDRLDYTKGLVERLQMFDYFFERYPDMQRNVVYLMIAAPTRSYIPAYRSVTHEVYKLVERINEKYKQNDWKPILLVNESVDPQKIYQYYSCADVCLVTSLHDGMNLVAKEYPICVEENKGVLLLSQYAGAAKEIGQAIAINPYDKVKTAETLHTALRMQSREKQALNQSIRQVLQQNTIDTWAQKFFREVLAN